jgi:hypothetical protein
MVQFLLSNKADYQLETTKSWRNFPEGLKPADIALSNNKTEVYEFLKTFGK